MVYEPILRLSTQLLAAPSPSRSPGGGCGGRVVISLDDGSDAPGIAGFRHLVNVSAVVALVGCAFGIVVGILMATSGRFADPRVGTAGRLAIVTGVLGAFGVGSAAAWINWSYNAGASSC